MHEIETSALQALFWSSIASRLSYETAPGASERTIFPKNGPFDHRRGYSDIPTFASRLEAHGFRVAAQARMSPALAELAAWGVAPPYREPAVTRLTIRSQAGTPLYDPVDNDRFFRRFEDVPPLLVATLLFMENRELLTPSDPRNNPVIEWDRLTKAALLFAGHKLGLSVGLEGGSTLATQLEKYRHSPHGRTRSAFDKIRQMVGASLKAYQNGPDTRRWRQQIVVDYFNTLPLAAAPGHGELYGLGEGLYAWFGLELGDVSAALAATPDGSPHAVTRAQAYKHALALLAAVRAPTTYLVTSRPALERRVNDYTRLLAHAGVITPAFAQEVLATPLAFAPRAPVVPSPSFVEQKASNAIRTGLLGLLGVRSLYELDRLHLEVDATINAELQNAATELFQHLRDPEFVAAHHLKQKHLLRSGDPAKVVYSLMLFERTADGNVLRVQADNLDRPFDINDGIKMELGSTAKLRTLAHYLELVAELYRDYAVLDAGALRQQVAAARDPITRWVAQTMAAQPGIDMYSLLEGALDRRYSASPYETFFTGGGIHTFGNFDPDDNGRVMPVREALRRSTNLVFIRLMRDLVRFHEARLPYDAAAVMTEQGNPERRRLLEKVADAASTEALGHAYRTYRGLAPDAIIDRLLGKRASSPRRLTMLFFAWHPGADAPALRDWLARRLGAVSDADVQRLFRAYGNPRLNIADFGYLLSRHPLDVWCAGELTREPDVSWSDLLDRSDTPRRIAWSWLFRARNRRAQDVRLRIRIEQDAFARMTPYWQHLGFPFEQLVPSYATAIGNSSDRPAALADLMGIIVNGGVRRPLIRTERLRFARGTPYETVFVRAPAPGERVMEIAVARALRAALADVVEHGTARRVAGAFVGAGGKRLLTGGKTGSGDNRYKTFNRYGEMLSSRAVNRTATFVFYIDDRYFGVVTAFVDGRAANQYEFTSSLPLSVLKLAAPAINKRL